MRIAALILVSALGVTACGQGAPGGGGAFPNLTAASYRAEATIEGPDGQPMPVVMIRSGNKVRMELAGDMGQMAMVTNADTGQNFVLITNDGRTMAMQSAPVDYENPSEAWGADYASTARRTGACAVAGETGSEWTQETDGETTTACVTDDGIILRATRGGETTWETTSVQRGPQSADLFVMPEGVAVMDMNALGGAVANSAVSGQASPELCNTLRQAGAPADALSRAGC